MKMAKSLKYILFSIAGLIVFVILIVVGLLYFVDTGVYKPRLEKAASDALGMEVRIGARPGLSLFPGLSVRLGDLSIRNRETDLVSAQEAGLDIALRPLLRREIRIMRIVLKHPRISIQRYRDGTYNFETSKAGTLPTPAMPVLSLSDGILRYHDEQSGSGFEALNLNLNLRSLRLAGGNNAELVKRLFFAGSFACREIRTKELVASDVRFTCTGSGGRLSLDPVELRLFGGQGSGMIRADFSGAIPSYSLRASLSKFRIEDYLKTLSPKKVASGSMDFSVTLSMQGKTARELKRTLNGEASLRGGNLTLYGSDLDRALTRFESSQNYSLVDAGAFLFAGPLGMAVTRGYSFAGVLLGSDGNTGVRRLFSDWKVERGIAHARDVALATKENRIALQGNINFVNERFENVTIALIDDKGCARVKQKISGPLKKPVVEKPNVLAFLTGPALNLLKKTKDFLTGTCEVFYAGSVAAPR